MWSKLNIAPNSPAKEEFRGMLVCCFILNSNTLMKHWNYLKKMASHGRTYADCYMTTSLLTTILLGRLSRYYFFIYIYFLSLNLVASIFFFLLLINFFLLQLLDENSSGILSRMQVMEVYLSLYPSAILSLLSLSLLFPALLFTHNVYQDGKKLGNWRYHRRGCR